MGSRSQVVDPPPVVREGGGGGGWAWLVTARGIIEAQLIRGVVEEAGVTPVWLDTRDPSPGAWMFLSGNPNAPVAIYVPASMLETARLALLESGLGSTAHEGPSTAPTVRWGTWSIVAALLAALVILILLLASARNAVTS